MEQNISRMTILGVFMIILAAVIGMGFGIFTIAKGVSNEGVVNVQSNLEGATESVFDMYDNKIVTGNQLVGLYKEVEGKPVGLLVRTKSLGSGLSTYKGRDNANLYIQRVGEEDYINYNAIISNGKEEIKQIEAGNAIETGVENVITIDKGEVRSVYGIMTDEHGRLVLNNRIEGISKEGNAEYIAANTKFNSKLIRDLSGSIVGVKLLQLD